MAHENEPDFYVASPFYCPTYFLDIYLSVKIAKSEVEIYLSSLLKLPKDLG
jgi:hypothetical protein